MELSILRRLTAPIRCRPDFLIIGAQKCGTTSLYHYLSGHPAVLPAKKKETHFFDSQFHLGPARYRAWFPPAAARWLRARKCGGRAVTGEATPYYLFHPLVPERVKRITPGSKFIAVLRNPIDRAYSHWKLESGRGNDSLPFAEAVRREEERIGADLRRMTADLNFESPVVPRWSYLARGRYAEQIERWWHWFPRERLLVLRSEDLWTGDDAAARRVERHLGLAPAPRAYPRRQATPEDGGPDPETRRWLAEYFEPHNRRLREILGDEFRWE